VNYDYYPSGSNHVGEIQGFAAVGMNVGVSADELGERAIAELVALDSPTKVFLDSGAFSEVAEIRGGTLFDGMLYVRKQITPQEWDRRLSIAGRIVRGVRSRLLWVAPDRVGSQEETLRRLIEYRRVVRRVASLGASTVCVIQRGDCSALDFAKKIDQVVGSTAWVVGFPMKRNATKRSTVIDFVKARRPKRVHLLGLGPKSNGFDDLLDKIRRASPDTIVSCDSNRLRALVGRKPVRALTAAQDAVKEGQILDNARTVIGEYDWTEWITDPSYWLTGRELFRFALTMSDNYKEYRRIVADATAWLDEPIHKDMDRYEDPQAQTLLNAAWDRYICRQLLSCKKRIRELHNTHAVTERKKDAIVQVFKDTVRRSH
jgi:hypothetical protein